MLAGIFQPSCQMIECITPAQPPTHTHFYSAHTKPAEFTQACKDATTIKFIIIYQPTSALLPDCICSVYNYFYITIIRLPFVQKNSPLTSQPAYLQYPIPHSMSNNVVLLDQHLSSLIMLCKNIPSYSAPTTRCKLPSFNY